MTHLDNLRKTLDADGYVLAVDDSRDDLLDVRISARDGICSDCLVPKHLMATMIAAATGRPSESIRIAYPAEVRDDGTLVGADG
ncbi:MAG: hypothetical protein MOP51_288 [Citricoccus sp.]|jgi:hypothetical protein|nr:hypothetical protein [Citricoccus sp. WCRC_4]